MSEAFRSALIAQFKKLQRRSPVPAQDWPTVAPLVVTRFGRGKALAAIQRLKEIDVDDHQRASVDVALEALGLGRYRGSVETRLAYAGAALDPPVGYWRARDYAEQGYAILADLALSDRYSDEPGFTIAVSPACEGFVTFAVDVEMGTPRQDVYIDLKWQDEIDRGGSETIHIPRDGHGYLDNFDLGEFSLAGRPIVSVTWPEGLDAVVFAYSDIPQRVEYVKVSNSAWVAVLPPLQLRTK